MRRILIRINNYITRRRRIRVPPEKLLLLAPHCLQNQDCRRKVTVDLAECARCGLCRVSDIIGLCREYGIAGHLAGGGRHALDTVRKPEVRAVVAVACEKELCEGIFAAFPKPVLAVVNELPNGPCRNTTVDIAAVRAAILELLEKADPCSVTEKQGVQPAQSVGGQP